MVKGRPEKTNTQKYAPIIFPTSQRETVIATASHPLSRYTMLLSWWYFLCWQATITDFFCRNPYPMYVGLSRKVNDMYCSHSISEIVILLSQRSQQPTVWWCKTRFHRNLYTMLYEHRSKQRKEGIIRPIYISYLAYSNVRLLTW